MKYLMLWLLFPSCLFGEDMVFDKDTGQAIPTYVGQLKRIKGKVFKRRPQGQLIEVESGERFNKNDTLVTESKSFAKLLIVDDTELTIGPKTELNFENFKYVSKTDRQVVYNLLKGQLTGDVKNKAKEEEVVFKTKNATLGVRGTKILVNHQTLKNLEISEFALLTGSATVIDELKKLKHNLNKNERLVIVNDTLINHSGLEKSALSPAVLEHLEGEENFLPYFLPQESRPGSELSALLHKKSSASSSDPSAPGPGKKEPGPSGTFQNLKKLNEKLRKNQQRQ